jgi:hypothetical protein
MIVCQFCDSLCQWIFVFCACWYEWCQVCFHEFCKGLYQWPFGFSDVVTVCVNYFQLLCKTYVKEFSGLEFGSKLCHVLLFVVCHKLCQGLVQMLQQIMWRVARKRFCPLISVVIVHQFLQQRVSTNGTCVVFHVYFPQTMWMLVSCRMMHWLMSCLFCVCVLWISASLQSMLIRVSMFVTSFVKDSCLSDFTKIT